MWAWCWMGIWSQIPRRRLKWWLGFLPQFLRSSFGEYVNKVGVWRFMGCDEMLHKRQLAGVTARSLSIIFEQFWWLHKSSRGQRFFPLSLALVRHIRSAGCCAEFPSTRRCECSGGSPVKGCGGGVEPRTNEGRLGELWLFILELEDIQGRYDVVPAQGCKGGQPDPP